MAIQTHSRLAAHIARGNVVLLNVPPTPAPAPIPAQPPAGGRGGEQPPTGGEGGGQPPTGSEGEGQPPTDGRGGGQPPASGGGGGQPPTGGGGGGQPPARGAGGGQANPPPAAPNLRLCRNPPEIFIRDREKADCFLSQLKCYYLANIGVPEFNSWIQKVVIACMYIQGPLVDKWVDRAVDWLS